MRALLPVALVVALVAGPALAQTVSLPKRTYAPGEAVVVTVTNVASPRDWVTVVPAGTPTDSYGSWDWVEQAGSLTFTGLAPGAYEVRAYCCWVPGRPGHGGYNVRSRVAFTVGARGGGSGQQVSLSVPSRVGVGERIVVEYTAEPAHESDWISIAPVGAADDAYVRWDYTGGFTSGIEGFDGLGAGRYEARFYCCWAETSSYAVVARRTFVVE